MAYKPKGKISKKTSVKVGNKMMMGDEPLANSDLSEGSSYGIALSWYSRLSDNDQRYDWIHENMTKRGYDEKAIKLAFRSGRLAATQGGIARLLNRNCILPEGSLEKWEATLEDAIAAGTTMRDEATSKIDRSANNPAARSRAKAMQIRTKIDELFDNIMNKALDPKGLKLFEEFQKWELKGKQAHVLLPIYQLQLTEYSDPEVQYAKCVPRARLETFCKTLVEALRAWTNSKEKEDAPAPRGRPKAVRTPAAAVSSMKYKVRDEESMLVSVDPKYIVGSQMVVLYNPKYRQLTLLRAATAEGLSVKGTTILNEDPATSSAKRAGRHITKIKEMAGSSKSSILKEFGLIDSALIEARTRTSEDILIVRVIK